MGLVDAIDGCGGHLAASLAPAFALMLALASAEYRVLQPWLGRLSCSVERLLNQSLIGQVVLAAVMDIAEHVRQTVTICRRRAPIVASEGHARHTLPRVWAQQQAAAE